MSAAGAGLAALAIASIYLAPLVIEQSMLSRPSAGRRATVAREDARRRDSYRLLQALGREDGYLLAMESGEDGR
jgi:hypothetical protein